MLDHLVASRYVLEIEAEMQVVLPDYAGSTFRGALGGSFRRVACTLRLQQCDTCLLRESCAYSIVFETPVPDNADMMKLYPFAPHPFVLEPPSVGGTMHEGETTEFGLVLIGRGQDFLPYFIYAMELMCERGLGRGRGRCKLNGVRTGPSDGSPFRAVYDGEQKTLHRIDASVDSAGMCERIRAIAACDELRLVFETPTRVKHRGRYINPPEMYMMVPALLRRLTALAYFHCSAPFCSDVATEIEASKRIELVRSDTRWCDWERYSSRQDRRMRLGGFVGEVEYRGDFGKLAPALAWGEILHLGKGSSFGLGKYRIMVGDRQ